MISAVGTIGDRTSNSCKIGVIAATHNGTTEVIDELWKRVFQHAEPWTLYISKGRTGNLDQSLLL